MKSQNYRVVAVAVILSTGLLSRTSTAAHAEPWKWQGVFSNNGQVHGATEYQPYQSQGASQILVVYHYDCAGKRHRFDLALYNSSGQVFGDSSPAGAVRWQANIAKGRRVAGQGRRIVDTFQEQSLAWWSPCTWKVTLYTRASPY